MSGFFTPLFLCQKLVFLIHAVALYLLRFSRLEIDGRKKENKIIFLEKIEEQENAEEIYLRFEFPRYHEIHDAAGVFSREAKTEPEEDRGAAECEYEVTHNTDSAVPDSDSDGDGFLSESDGDSEVELDIQNEAKSKYELTHDSDSTVSVSDSYSDGFLSDGDFEVELGIQNRNESSETVCDVMGDDHLNGNKGSFLSDIDFDEDEVGIEKSRSNEHSPEDDNELESLWEHQELIEQLKIELKKVRATGLPTILEDSESPKLMDHLKPWKIDEFKRGGCFGELHKFYKSYREKMRKFDIINYQKMYAMGFLQLKDPMKSMSIERPLAPTLKSIVPRNLWVFKNKIHGTDPTKRLVQELQGDLEGVYVGQMCLSWEFLHWQYERALDLWDSDRRGANRCYNEVAGEFQQFQVLLQRFIEDEPFQGPRVQSYVKTRCAVRNLLQVPVIRDDNLKDKRKARAKGQEDYTITSDMLVETVEESIRIFWRFVRADKECTTSTINGHKPELAGPEDLDLLMVIKRNLQKKERKLRDILRSENCILRKFRQCRDHDSDDQVLYFFAQVDMRLVCRVLNMSKVTNEQLVWCLNKLNRIRFVNRRIHVEPAFLLFPC